MAIGTTPIATLLFIATFLVLLPSDAYAFGAGDIPDFAYLNDKAFRHGDIENILEQIAKSAGHAAMGGGIFGFAKKVMNSGGKKFDKTDIKKVYFGNWLRDYSQAMDIAGLQKLSADTLILVVSVLGFMTFGFATREFEVTADRLGVYLPVEHIDNPKGYAEQEGDARKFHPKLRPPVQDCELEIDPRNGMKKYMATEDEGFDTSTAHVRRTLRACIEYGRRSGGEEGADLYEAYRLMGTGLHTMEDLLAHSNWCEIALRKMGHSEVFCHVGDDTDIDTPNGRAPPLVTGTFGSSDFIHSLMGEATDHISQASVTALSQNLSDPANNDSAAKFADLKNILGKLPIGGSSAKLNQGQQMQEESKAYHFNPDNVAPPEVQKQLIQLLRWRDDIYRDILEKIDMIPGLANLIDQLSNALNAYIYTVIAPYITPILTQATAVLGEGSKAVIDTVDQYEVFNNPKASDPSHSLLSKDHFGLILNEPAGKVAQVVVLHSAQLLVKAWSTDDDPDRYIDTILEAFHHPYFVTGNSQIQHQMMETLEQWFGGLGSDAEHETLQALTKESVRAGKNKRLGDEGEGMEEVGYGGCGHGGPPRQTSTQTQSQQSYGGESYGETQQQQGYSSNAYGSSNLEYDNTERTSYAQPTYGSSHEETEYSTGKENNYEPPTHSYDQPTYGSSREETDYSSGRERNYEPPTRSYGHPAYGSSQEETSYSSGRERNYEPPTRSYDQSTYGSGRGETDYSSGRERNYEPPRRPRDEYEDQPTVEPTYNREQRSGYNPSYGSGDEYSGGGRRGEYGETRDEYDRGHRQAYGESRGPQEYSEGREDYGGAEYGRRGGYGGGREGYNDGREEYDGGRREEYGEPEYGRGREQEHRIHGEQYGGVEYGGGDRGVYAGRTAYSPGQEDDEAQYIDGQEIGLGRGEYGGGGGNDNTFGAERLNINDNGDEYGGRPREWY